MPTRTKGLAQQGRETEQDAAAANIYRSFTFGDLASLNMLENRLVNRSNGEVDPFPHERSPGAPPRPPGEAASARVADIIAGKPPQEWADDEELEAGVLREEK